MPGAIYLVATPLGNLEDITLRALRVLREADVIACEDTRHTRKLLDHYEIRKPLVSYHEHNETARATDLVQRAAEGQSVAVVSDAGMPGISDPGYRVVQEALRAGVTVVPLPGPSALAAALPASGLPTDAFRFSGFLPPKETQRCKMLEELAAETATLVFYEAPHRLRDTLANVLHVLGDRPVVVARELTKIHEEFLRGRVSEVIDELARRDSVKGEITLLIGRGSEASLDKADLPRRVTTLMEQGVPRMDAIKQAARESGITKRAAYRLLEGEQ